MTRHAPHVENALHESNGYANPFMALREPVAILAYHQFEGKTLGECVTEYDRLTDVLKQVAGQGTADDGSLDLEKVTLFSGTPQDKGERIIEINSRLGGLMQALTPKRHQAHKEEMARQAILNPETDENGLPLENRVIRPSDLAVMQLREQGIELGSEEFRGRATGGQRLSWEYVFPKNVSPQRFLAATFQTSSWQPDIIDEPGWVPLRATPISVSQIIPTFMTGRDAVDWMEESTQTSGAQPANEAAQVGEATYVLSRRNATVERIAHHLPITEESLADEPEVRSYLDYVMPLGVRQRLDQQIVSGDGSAPNLQGILSAGHGGVANRRIQERRFTRTGSNVGAITGNPWNLLLDAAYDIQDHGFGVLGLQMPSHAVLVPNIYLECMKATSTAGGYYVGGPQSPMMKMAWGMIVVESNHLTTMASPNSGTAYMYGGIIGDFSPMFIRLWMRHDVRTEVGMMNDDFRRYQLTMRSSVRAVFAITRATAFVGLVNPKADGSLANAR